MVHPPPLSINHFVQTRCHEHRRSWVLIIGAKSTGACLILLALAAMISTQLLMMTDRDVPFAARLRDLNEFGDSVNLLAAACLLAAALGAVAGSLFDHPGIGAVAGLAVAILTWTSAVIWAHKRPQPPARHRVE
jgi:hypothetical protein